MCVSISVKTMKRRLLLVLILLLVYNVNLRQVSSHDTFATRFVPISILRDGDLILDEFVPDHVRHPPPDYDFPNFTPARGHYYDSHPPVGPILALPVYALPIWMNIPADAALAANMFSKLAASIMAALSALAIFAAVNRLLTDAGRPSESVAFVAALAYGLTTSVWSTASLALWSHTPAILGYAVALWALCAGWTGTAGFSAAAAAMSRPATAPAAVLLMLFAVHRAYRHGSLDEWLGAARGLAVAALVAGGAGIYNVWLLGNPLGGARGRTEFWLRELNAPTMFSGSLLEGLAGLTISPGYGLIVFSPIVAIALVGAIDAWRTRPVTDAFLLARYVSLAGLVILLTYAKFIAWWGGHGFGPRYLTDAMPFVGMLFGLGFAVVGRTRLAIARAAVFVLVVYSFAIQAVGAFCWPSPWALENNPPPYLRAWEWRDNPIASAVRSGPKFDPAARKAFSVLAGWINGRT